IIHSITIMIVTCGGKSDVRVLWCIPVLYCNVNVITAGFWNSHVHFFERKWADAASIPAFDLHSQLEAMLTRYGFTSVWDTWSMWENTRKIRERIESGEVAGPRIHSTGEAIFGSGAAAAAGSTLAAAWSSLGFMPLAGFQ